MQSRNAKLGRSAKRIKEINNDVANLRFLDEYKERKKNVKINVDIFFDLVVRRLQKVPNATTTGFEGTKVVYMNTPIISG